MVNKFVLILLLILVGLLSCEPQELEKPLASDHHQNLTSGPLSQAQFRDFMFVQTWPPTFCLSQRCAQNPGRFTIHGLWPQLTTYRGRDQLTDAILDPRETALLQNWPDLRTTDFLTSKGFWRYEYNKHGVYCTSRYSAEEYIVKALTLGDAFKPRAWLARQNIVPVANRRYSRSAIVAALRSYTSVTPDLQCYTNRGNSYLLEVRLCLDDKLERFINCAGRVGQCGTQIYYPPSPSSVSQTSDEILEMTEDLVNSFEAV